MTGKITLVFLSNTCMYSCTLSSWENGISLNKLFILGGRLVHPLKRTGRAEACRSYGCKTRERQICYEGFLKRISQQNPLGSGHF